MSNQLTALELRIEKLEALTRPLRAARTTVRSSDDKMLAALADEVGVDIARLQGDERSRGVAAARRVVAKILIKDAGWSIGRTARVLRKDRTTVREMLP